MDTGAAMIEFIVLLIIVCAVVSALRKPRTFAEAQYAEYRRAEQLPRKRLLAWALLIICAVILAIGSIHP